MMYQIRQMWLALRGNFTAALATLTTMTLTLALLGAVSLLTLNLERTLSGLEKEVEVSAFLLESANDATLLKTVQALPQVASARIVTKGKALEQLGQDLPGILEPGSLEENPLPDSLRLTLKNPRDVQVVAAQLKALVGVESVEYGEGYVDQALSTLESVRFLGYGLVLLLLLNSLFNILSTVRVGMFARRVEIEVMRLLGARRGFIRAPYVLEGIVLGLLSSLITAALLYPAYFALTGQLRTLLPSLPLLEDRRVVLELLVGLVGLGVLVGGLGSWFAANRYLRELE
ncbi:MAG: ABC transporter permease [Pseudopedobacter sp.]|nr:ABC transporter permease [Deinococcales bacterium]